MDEATIRRLPTKVGAGDAILYKGGWRDGPREDSDEYQMPPLYHDGYSMRWAEWVAFAEKIIEADRAAREPGPGEIMQFVKKPGMRAERVIRKLEDYV